MARRLDWSTTWIPIGQTDHSSGGCTGGVAPSKKSTSEPSTCQRSRADTSFQPCTNTPSVSLLSGPSSAYIHGSYSFLNFWCTGCLEAYGRTDPYCLHCTHIPYWCLCLQGSCGTPQSMVPLERLLLPVSSILFLCAASHQRGCSVWEHYSSNLAIILSRTWSKRFLLVPVETLDPRVQPRHTTLIPLVFDSAKFEVSDKLRFNRSKLAISSILHIRLLQLAWIELLEKLPHWSALGPCMKKLGSRQADRNKLAITKIKFLIFLRCVPYEGVVPIFIVLLDEHCWPRFIVGLFGAE